jgi:hypothetical protein
MNILVSCKNYWIGDCLFASSLAKKLAEKYPGSIIDYWIPLVQPKLLLEKNPYINKVFVENEQNLNTYQMFVTPPMINQEYPATLQIQASAGITNQSLEFDVFTSPEHDVEIESMLSLMYKDDNRLKIAWQRNWEEKSFGFTNEEYERAIDVPNLGYGGRRRDIKTIVRELSERFIMIPVGFPPGVPQYNSQAQDCTLYSRTASLIKKCDYFIGSEGGLSNLACAVGTNCIITTDFIAQLYWKNGVIRQLDNPQMGPFVYYPMSGHSHLDPFLTDKEVVDHIDDIINTNTPEVFNWES